MNTLPFDVIINHIIPYTYSPQPPALVEDICSYVSTLPILEDILLHEPAPFAMVSVMSKLYVYMNGDRDMIYGVHSRFLAILRRHRALSKRSDKDIITYLYQNLQYADQNKQLRFLWGLLRAAEHRDFIEFVL